MEGRPNWRPDILRDSARHIKALAVRESHSFRETLNEGVDFIGGESAAELFVLFLIFSARFQFIEWIGGFHLAQAFHE